MPGKLIPLLLALIGVVLVSFGLWPGMDLAVAGYFHDESGWPVKQNHSVEVLRTLVWDLTLLMPLLALGLLIWARLRAPVLALPARLWVFVLLLYVIGPGIVVNGLLKAHWGRARPINVADFGGTAQFTPAWQITDQCAANCSFVSGEGAGTMAMVISVGLILSLMRDRLSQTAQRLGQGALLIALGFVGWQRVASGGHFLSDVLLSWLLIALIAAILARFLPIAAKPCA